MNSKNNRRNFLSNLASGLTLFALSNLFLLKRLNAKSKPKVLIIGSGIGGLTCLSYLNKISDAIDIIVIDKNKSIRTGPLSNLVLGGILSEEKITFTIDPKKYRNVKFVYEILNSNFYEVSKSNFGWALVSKFVVILLLFEAMLVFSRG